MVLFYHFRDAYFQDVFITPCLHSKEIILCYCRHRRKVQIVSMILATGTRNITWNMAATAVGESRLVVAEVEGNLLSLP